MLPEDLGRLKPEMATWERDLKAIEAGYGENVLNLTLASAYLRKLLGNVNVARLLLASHADIYAEFEKVATADTLSASQLPAAATELFIFY